MNEYIITNIGMIVAIIISIILLIGMFKQSNKTYKDRTTKPWGEEEVIFENYNDTALTTPTKVKILRILPNHSLSKQYHQYKTEMMVCLKGSGIFEMNGLKKEYTNGFRIFIDSKDIHRILAHEYSEFIELSNGFDSDITRVEDEYGRK